MGKRTMQAISRVAGPAAALAFAAWMPNAHAQSTPPGDGSTQVAPPVVVPPVPAPAPPPPGAHTRDGFYLRASTGFTGYSEIIGHRGNDQRLTITGVGTMGELALGGTVGRNVFGGGIWGASILASDVTASNGGSLAGAPTDRATFVLIGPFVDHYFEGDRELHLQFGLGFAAVRGVDFGSYGAPDTKSLAPGGGVTVAFGKDWWVSDQWSVGVLGRVSAAAAGEKSNGITYYHLVAASPGFAFTVAYH